MAKLVKKIIKYAIITDFQVVSSIPIKYIGSPFVFRVGPNVRKLLPNPPASEL